MAGKVITKGSNQPFFSTVSIWKILINQSLYKKPNSRISPNGNEALNGIGRKNLTTTVAASSRQRKKKKLKNDISIWLLN